MCCSGAGRGHRANDASSRRPIVLVSVATFVVASGLGTLPPAVPDLAKDLNLTAMHVGFLLAAFPLGRLVAAVPSGILIDRIGGRRVASVGCAIAVFFALAAWRTGGLAALIVFQVLQGIGSAFHNTAAMTFVLGIAPKTRTGHWLAVHQSMVLLGISCSPIIGGIAASAFGPRSVFLVYALLVVLGMVVTLVAMRGFRAHDHDHVLRSAPVLDAQRQRERRSLIENRSFTISMVSAFAIFLVLGGVKSALLPMFAADTLGFMSVGIGILLGTIGLVQAATTLLMGRIADWLGRRRMLLIGMTSVVGSLLLFTPGSGGWLWAAAVAFGIAIAVATVPLPAIVADVASPSTRGWATGVHRTATGLGLTIGPVFVGQVLELLTYRGAFLAMAVVLAVMTVSSWRIPESLIRVAGPREGTDRGA